ncbi:hypothetical protein KAU11_11645, partial [Candidatus Babeliales bacterium]|nr:hypothetical protein [Candidatus Babeliales bacterium]
TVKVSQTEKTENKTIKDDQVEKIPVIILVESEGDRELSRQERVKKRKPMTDEEFIQKHNNKIAQLLCIMDKSIIFNSENFTKGLRAGIDRIVEYKGAEYSIFVTKSFDQGSRDVIAHIIDNDDWVPEFNSENKCINLPTGENTERIRLSFDSKKEDSAADLGYHFVVELAKTSKLKNFLKYFLTLHMTRLGIETLNGHPGLSNKRTEVSIVETENVKDKELV